LFIENILSFVELLYNISIQNNRQALTGRPGRPKKITGRQARPTKCIPGTGRQYKCTACHRQARPISCRPVSCSDSDIPSNNTELVPVVVDPFN